MTIHVAFIPTIKLLKALNNLNPFADLLLISLITCIYISILSVKSADLGYWKLVIFDQDVTV